MTHIIACLRKVLEKKNHLKRTFEHIVVNFFLKFSTLKNKLKEFDPLLFMICMSLSYVGRPYKIVQNKKRVSIKN